MIWNLGFAQFIKTVLLLKMKDVILIKDGNDTKTRRVQEN